MLQKKIRVLLVKNTKLVSGMIRRILEEIGYTIVGEIENGKKAVTLTQRLRPDVVVMDLERPYDAAIETARQIREWSPTPIVLVTGDEAPEFVEQASAVGIGAYLVKPPYASELFRAITIAMARFDDLAEQRRLNVTLQTEITQLRQAEQSLKDWDERLAKIFESAMDAIITIDASQKIVLFNKAAERVFQYSANQVNGQPVNRFLSEGLQELLQRFIQESENGEKNNRHLIQQPGYRAVITDCIECPLEASFYRFEMSGQKYLTITLREINELKKYEADILKLKMQNIYLQEEIKAAYNFEEIVGDSAVMRRVFQKIESVASTDTTVLISGETGTGKELIARAIHNTSLRKDRVMVKVNCATLPGTLIESELFGHEKGAFTGALARKNGRFELADGGTIFLDEIGDLPLELQVKLLRVLQDGEFERVGGSKTIKTDVRVIAATNCDLQKAIKESRFRIDLFYRLNVFPVYVPPLRERKEDIPSLIRHFVVRYGNKMQKRINTISQTALNTLMSYSWPGNVRELENVIERAIILSKGHSLELGEWFRETVTSMDNGKILTIENLERKHILEVLQVTGWRVSGDKGAAKILGLKPTTLEARMKKLGIKRKK